MSPERDQPVDAAPTAAPAGPPPLDPSAPPAVPASSSPPYAQAPAPPPPYTPPPQAPPPYTPATQAPGPYDPAAPQAWPTAAPGSAVYEWAPAEPPRRRRRGLWLGVGLGAAALLVIGGAVAAFVVWQSVQADERLAEARELSYGEMGVIRSAVDTASASATSIVDATSAYRTAADAWASSEASVAQWQGESAAPSVQEPNPGGSLPGGDADERAFLESIGAGDVQIILDAGDQNCGFDPRGVNWIAGGGCYDPQFRDWLFLAWEPGFDDERIWSVFVHEAMHWQQWDQLAVLYESASRAGINGDQYRGAIESDASCRAVYQHGIPLSAYEGSSSPCDVDGWTDTYLRDYLAGLGVPVAAPDPEAYEVEAVTRP